MTSTERQRWARCPPLLAWKRPGIPTEWTPVLERNDDAGISNPTGLPGYVWLAPPQGKRLHVWAAHLEFRDDPP